LGLWQATRSYGMPKKPSRPGTYQQFLQITCFIRRIILIIEIVIL